MSFNSSMSNPGSVVPAGMTVPHYSDNVRALELGILGSLFGLAMLAFGSRVATRLYPYPNLGWDDFAITVAAALAITTWALIVTTVHFTGGRHTMYVSPENLTEAFRYSFFLILMWTWSLTWVKISISLMLLRIKQSRAWKMGISSMIAFLMASAIASTIAALFQCSPIRANWDLELRQQSCWETGTLQTETYVVSSVFIITDFLCAFLPLIFILKINQPMREKIVLGVLMALGISASICGIMKILGLKALLSSKDPIRDGVSNLIWAFAEVYIGIIAACIPCLKAPFERIFHTLGGQMSVGLSKVQSTHTTHTSRQSASRHDLEIGYSLGSLRTQQVVGGKLANDRRSPSDEDILLELGKSDQYNHTPRKISVRKDVEVSWSRY